MNPLRKKLRRHLQVIMGHSAKLEASIAIMRRREPRRLPLLFRTPSGEPAKERMRNLASIGCKWPVSKSHGVASNEQRDERIAIRLLALSAV